ncbi:uncharacterized protein LOC141915445 [Tubulanus polymorphus]|uniref:uncharacterized protein LOC141915445 n=1 Tax=Tubulanus polymorphus TaxID=672921 RepID=UPI003DA39818
MKGIRGQMQNSELLEDIMKQDDSKDAFNSDLKKKVGDYVIGKVLGEGAFAKVRLGIHLPTKEKVAVKIVNKANVKRHPYMKKHFRREATILQKLDHPNIIQIYDLMETENCFYLVTEWADGGDFVKYLNLRRILNEFEARRIMRQLVSAVDHMHKTHVVHRDLKLENVMLDKDINVKLIDFGLGNVFNDSKILLTNCGSPGYTAPEVLTKKPHGPAVDIWALGINLFVMLTGTLPFLVDSPTNYTKLHATMLKGPNIPSHLSDECQDLLNCLLDPDPSRRIKMAVLRVHPWLNDGFKTFPQTVPLKRWPPTLDQDITDFMMDELDIDSEDIRISFANAKINCIMATYSLLKRRKLMSLPFPKGEPLSKDDIVDDIPQLDRSPGVRFYNIDISGDIDYKLVAAGEQTGEGSERIFDTGNSKKPIYPTTLYEAAGARYGGERLAQRDAAMSASSRSSLQTKDSNSVVDYRDCLRKLYVKSREGAHSVSEGVLQLATKRTPSRGSGTATSLSMSSSSPKQNKQYVRQALRNQFNASNSKIRSKIGDIDAMKGAITYRKLKPGYSGEYDGFMRRSGNSTSRLRVLKTLSSSKRRLPVPPPNSAAHRQFDLDSGTNNGRSESTADETSRCNMCENLAELEREFYCRFRVQNVEAENNYNSTTPRKPVPLRHSTREMPKQSVLTARELLDHQGIRGLPFTKYGRQKVQGFMFQGENEDEAPVMQPMPKRVVIHIPQVPNENMTVVTLR